MEKSANEKAEKKK